MLRRTTRLLVRARYAYTRWWAPLIVEPVEAVSFLMSHTMLRGFRDRAETERLVAVTDRALDRSSTRAKLRRLPG
jgi:hypothetical protein